MLVVDDDRTNRAMLASLLGRKGFDVSLAADGRTALTMIDNAVFDAVLLDIVMPGMDGIAVLRALKSDPSTWRIPVIMISAVDEVDSIVTCLELGADDYVPKPFDPVILQARLGACLARRRFNELETEYQRLVAQQAAEIEDLRQEVRQLRRDDVT